MGLGTVSYSSKPPSTPKSLLPPSPISDVLNSSQQASKSPTLAPNAGYGLLNPGTTTPAAKPAPAPKTTPGPAAASPPPSADHSAALSGAYDLSTDPIVQKIQALNAQTYGSAVATADAARKQALIASGFGDLAGATQYGSLENPTTGDQATQLAAQQNPFSTAMNLMHAHAGADAGIDQNTNDQNLYFSSERGNELGNEAHNYVGQVAGAEDTVRSQLDQILQTLLGVKTSGQSDLANAYETARQDAISNALASGQTFLGYDANGNPIFGAPPSTTPPDTTPPATPPVTGAVGPSVTGGTAQNPTVTTPIAAAIINAIIPGAIPNAPGSNAPAPGAGGVKVVSKTSARPIYGF